MAKKPKPAMGEQARTALRLVVGGGPAAAGALPAPAPAAAPALEPNRPEPAPAAADQDGGERLPIGVSAAAAPGWRRIVRELERARGRAELDRLKARVRELEAETAHLRRRLARDVEAAERRGRADARAHDERRIFRGLLS